MMGRICPIISMRSSLYGTVANISMALIEHEPARPQRYHTVRTDRTLGTDLLSGCGELPYIAML